MTTSVEAAFPPRPRAAAAVGRAAQLLPWLLWLALFYGAWLVVNFGFGYWEQTRAHWHIALAMALGSFVAGSTPMGGGTVGFPVLVLAFGEPASYGRNFSLFIQSIGMTSASIFIVAQRIPVEWRVLGYAVVGAALGLVAGTFLVVPRVGDEIVKLAFACLWASFGLLTLARNDELCGFHGLPDIPVRAARALGLTVGVIGGVTTSLTGVGIDMMLYTVLVLLYRMDLKAAVPTSVVIMAASSIMGAALHVAVGDIEPEVLRHWLAAAPVVILGAPLGAVFVHLVPRKGTLCFVAVLCVLQFAWTLREVRPSMHQWMLVLALLSLAIGGFVLLYQTGKALAEPGRSETFPRADPAPSLSARPRDPA